jgi:hypothetical protein
MIYSNPNPFLDAGIPPETGVQAVPPQTFHQKNRIEIRNVISRTPAEARQKANPRTTG